MAVAEEYNSSPTKVTFGEDAVVIRQYNGGITGGRALDYSSFTEDTIRAGHVIVRKLNDDNVYEYKPLGVSNGAYVALTTGEEYAGVVVRSKVKGDAVAIMDDGRVNDLAMPYPLTSAQLAAIKAALPKLNFEHD